MKKIFSVVLAAVMCLFAFASCGKQPDFSPAVIAVDGYTVDEDTISAVFYNKPSVDIYSDVKFSDGVARLYSDATYTEYLSDGLLDLSDGLNTFYFLVTKGARSVSYTLNITNYTITSLRIAENYTKNYEAGEGFERSSIKVFGVLPDGGEVEIKDYSLSYDFSSEGEHDVIVACGGVEYTFKTMIEGIATPILDDELCDSFGVKYALKEDEAVILDGSAAEGYFAAPEQVIYKGKSYYVTEIADRAFENNTKISYLTISGAVAIGENAFGGCSGLLSVSLGQGARIGLYSFLNCTAIEKITLPSDISEIPDGAFSGCEKIVSVIFPETLKTIGAHAFLDCASLESIDLHDGIEKIGARAFKGCSSVREIVCGASLKKLGYGAFSYCTSLTLIIIPEFVESDDGLLDGCPNVTLCSGPTSIAIYYAKRAGINTVPVKNGTMCVLDMPQTFYLGDEIRADSIRVVVSDDGYFGTVEHFGLKYDFSVPGKRTVTATYKDMSTSVDVFVYYEEYLLGGKDSYGAEYALDDEKGAAYLAYLPKTYPKTTFVLPTHIESDGVVYEVKGLCDGAIKHDALEKLILHSEINLIEEGAVCDSPNLSVVLCGVRQGGYLKIGKTNFKGLSDEFVILCELKNSAMQIFARTERIPYAKAEPNSLYIGAGIGAKTSYSAGEIFDPTNYFIALVHEDYSVTRLSANDVKFEFDFSSSPFVVCTYGEYITTYAASIVELQ
ncbi:MAG: leucine-rich repeat protein [Clostridia bacterium]|nr:leucine-rich repeat protein [Clostridia bacterium]